jgi:carbonic anhydrase/acetyltransferase-like protein (isoleucine patch superfamily)
LLSLTQHFRTAACRLNPLFVGTGCVLKSNTRVLSGASMDAHSVLLEHTLVMAGEVVDCGTVWQGWPTSNRRSLSQYRAEVRTVLC